MPNSNRFKMSQERLDALKEELKYLETVREKEVAEQIKEARSPASSAFVISRMTWKRSMRSSVLRRPTRNPAASRTIPRWGTALSGTAPARPW